MNVLTAAVPVPELLTCIAQRVPEKPKLFVTECRPFEQYVSAALSELRQTGYETVLLTDNMIGACMSTFRIDEAWGLCSGKTETHASGIGSAYTAALMADFHNVPFYLLEHSPFEPVNSGCFCGEDITVLGTAYISYAPDTIPLELVREVVQHET